MVRSRRAARPGLVRTTAGTNARRRDSFAGRPVPVPVFWMTVALVYIFVWRVVFCCSFHLLPDECSYWTWSRFLDWSYFDNSGMAAYLIRASTTLFGESNPFSVRFPFLLLSLGSTYLIYSISKELFGSTNRALLAALVVNLTPMALLGGVTAVHDNALVFFWLLTAWCAARFIRSEERSWFLWMGAAAGLAVLSKYTGVLAVVSLLLFLILSGEHRSLLLKKEPWIGAIIAGLFTLPIVIWNIQYDWASLHHILFIGTGAESVWKRIGDGIGYHASQFFVISPLFYAALVVGCVRSVGHAFRSADPRHILLLFFSFPLLLFGILAFRGHVEANWAAMAYPTAAIVAVEALLNRPRRTRDTDPSSDSVFFTRATWVSLGLSGILILHATVGILPVFLEKKLGKDDRIIWETTGWSGLGHHVDALRKPDDVIAADSYQLCALLEFNIPGQPKVRYLAPWKRPTQFDVRDRSYEDIAGRSVLFVSPDPLTPSVQYHATVHDNFQRVTPLPSYFVHYHGEPIREIHIARGYGFDPHKKWPLGGKKSLFYKDYH